MLGRLFRQNSSSSLNLDNPPVQTHQTNINSYEDSYTREILYGISDKSILNPFELNSKFFRILVSQDGGSLRAKQVLFDSSNNDKSPSGLPMYNKHSNLSRNIMTSKIHHNTNELHDYMFGCGLPTNEQQAITKIHILPMVNNQTYGSYKSILITRLFLITDNCENDYTMDDSWNPKPTLPIRRSKLSNNSNDNKNNVTGRFAIGLIIPVDCEYITDVVSNNWHEICHYLIILQKAISKKLIGLLHTEAPRPSPSIPQGSFHNESSCSNGNSYIVNKRIQFPSYILSNDIDLQSNLLKLIKLIYYNSNIPKLINSNSLMKLCVNSNSSSKYHPMMLNWVLEMLNWLEFKETNEHSRFLSSLLALIVPLRHLLTEKPFNHNYDTNSKEITRIVVMTGNPMVAKKLVFILNGLIPDNDVLELLDQQDHEADDSEYQDTDIDSVDYNDNAIADSDIESEPVQDQMKHTKFDNDIDDSYNPPSIGSHFIKPIPIKSKPSQSFSSPENSFSNKSLKGWEIPEKSTPITSTSISNPSNSYVGSSYNASIPISKPNPRSSLSKSSSMAYLSSSLNSSLSSSASNYSLSKLGGSFIDKWKNSFNNSIGSNYENIDYHHPQTPHTNLNRRVSMQAMKNPSPALEVEEFNLSLNSHHSSSNHSPKLIQSPNITASPVMSQNKLSKTQSMFDLYNNSIAQSNLNSKLMGNAISRSKASIYENPNFQKNKEIINHKVGSIMDDDVEVLQLDEATSEIDEYDDDKDPQLTEYEDLSPNVAFTDEFRPEFILQSCPMNPRLEQQVISSMKNDLLFSQNNCGVENITTRTVFISLRAREIKLIEMKIGDSTSVNSSSVSTPQPTVGSPLSSYFHHSPQIDKNPKVVSPGNTTPTANGVDSGLFRRGHNSYKTTIKKVYNPNKQSGDRETIRQVENNLKQINDLFISNYKDIHNEYGNFMTSDFNARLSELVGNLLK